MTRITDLLAMNHNADQRPYKFILGAQTSWFPVFYELEFAPDGWEDQIIFQRSRKYKGVFRKYNDGELKFPKDGREYLKNVYELKGVLSHAALIVYKLDHADFEYKEHFTGIIDFSTYKVDETFVSVQVLDNSFSEKVRNRENVEVDLLTEETLDGGLVPAFGADNTNFTFPAIDISSQANWFRTAIDRITFGASAPVPTEKLYFKMPLTYSEITEAQDLTANVWEPSIQYFIDGASDDFQANLQIKLKLHLWNAGPGGIADWFIRVYLGGADGGDVLIDEEIVWGTGGVVLDIDDERIINISSGAQLSLWATISRNPQYCGGCERFLDISNMDIKIEYQVSTIGQHFVTGLPIYEAFLRTFQKITNQTDCFKSEFFGRTDSEIRTYHSDGQLGHVTLGALIRRLDANLDVAFPTTPEDLFKSMNSLFNLGLGVEYEIGTGYIARVEETEYFFDDEVVLDISDRISEDEIGKEALPDWHFAQIKTGYAKTKKEVKGAIFEYNAKQTYATRISSLAPLDNTLDLISKFRADTNGIIVLREEYLSINSEDIDGDDDPFVVDTVRDPLGASEFRARTDEDFILIVGTIDSDQYYNYDFTPKRNLLRHGDEIRAGLEKSLNTELVFQAKDTIVNLETQRTAEASPIVEAANETVNDLNVPRWYAEAYTLEAPIYAADILLIEANPRGLIKLSATKYGWILKIMTNRDNKATLKLLRCNLDHVTPS